MTEPVVVMAAVNGARRMPADHPRLPIEAEAIASECAACAAAGAQAVHVHVRDENGQQSLDAARFREATVAIRRAAGDRLIVQATTEAVGRFSPEQQMDLVRRLLPEAVSIAMKELVPDDTAVAAATDFYRWAAIAGIAVQHILYGVDELERFFRLADRGVFPALRHSLLFPLGRYTPGQQSAPGDMLPFLSLLAARKERAGINWMCCAFGKAETEVVTRAAALGGHCRVGFENNFLNTDGTTAVDNAERVKELVRALVPVGRPLADRETSLRVLGKP